MRNTCALPTLWVDLALAAVLRAIWFRGSTALATIAVKRNCERLFVPFRLGARNQHRKFCGPTLLEGRR
jgi:hypothetical protein